MPNNEENNIAIDNALGFYGISREDDFSTFKRKVCENIHIPTYEQFKEGIFNFIKDEGISDTKKYVEDAFNPDSYLNADNEYYYHEPLKNTLRAINKRGYGYHQRSLENDIEEFFIEMVDKMNCFDAISAYVAENFQDETDDVSADEGMYSADTIYALMPDQYDDRNPSVLFDSYLERLANESMQELKDFIMSLTK